MAINTKAYIEKFLKIRTKESSIIDFKLNYGQQKLYDAIATQHSKKMPIRIIVLKARQIGFSTLTEGIIFKRTATAKFVNSAIVAHKADSTKNLYDMSKLFYEQLPDAIKPEIKANNAKVLEFDNESGTGLKSSIKVMTAGGHGIGRSDTLQNLHVSEYAFWPGEKEDTLIGLMSAVPDMANTMVIIESTANGFDEFQSRWEDAVNGKSDFVPVFCGWHELANYRSFYNGFELTSEEKELKEKYNLDNEQLAWRRRCIRTTCGNDLNRFKQDFPICPEEAFLSTGRPVFDNEIIVNRISQLKDLVAIKIGFKPIYKDSESRDKIIAFKKLQYGDVCIFEEPVANVPYVIGADTAGEGSDAYTAYVLRNDTGEQVASLHLQLKSADCTPFVELLYCMGKYYNDALIAPEINFNLQVVAELQRLRYPKIYLRQKLDDFRKIVETKYGWKTDGTTRPMIISIFSSIIVEHVGWIRDIELLRECLTFEYDKEQRPDARSGHHDDRILAAAIAYKAREQQQYTGKQIFQKVYLPDDIVSDYKHSSDEIKALMREKFGGVPTSKH